MKKLLITAINVFLFSIPLVSNATITFNRTYAAGSEGNFVQQTTDGGYIVTGRCSGGSWDYIVFIKTDSLGATVWNAFVDNPAWQIGSVYGECARQTADTGYITLENFFSASQNFGIITKIGSMGDIWWEKYYDEGFHMYSIRQTTDSGYIISGGFFEPIISKVDFLGTTVWKKTFYNPDIQEKGYVESSVSQQLPDKGYIACFITHAHDSTYKPSAFLLKTDSLGDSLWAKKIVDSVGGCQVEIYDFQRTTDGGYIMAGSNGGICLLKTDSLGDTLWTKTFGGGSGYSVRQTSDGGFIIAGGGYLIKTDSSGDTLWTKGFGGCCVEQTADGGYIITGSNGGIYLIKTDSVGNVGVEEKSNIKNQISKIEIVPNPAVSVLNIRLSGINKGENIDLKIYDLSGRIVTTFSQSEINSLNIKWNGVNEKGIKLKNGVYFCKLTSNGKTIREKIVLMR
ncbi:MAG: T9SS type A sorting domain-containing protein [bacterium]|nr:T9SS type A sorting domain-containing protein [bacterium]